MFIIKVENLENRLFRQSGGAKTGDSSVGILRMCPKMRPRISPRISPRTKQGMRHEE